MLVNFYQMAVTLFTNSVPVVSAVRRFLGIATYVVSTDSLMALEASILRINKTTKIH
jgi:hypothetical protein